MYKIVLINGSQQTLIHYPDPGDAVCKVFKADLDEKESQVSQLTLDIPFFNPGYNAVTDRVTLVQVIRIKDNVVVWRGRVIDTQDHMDENDNPFYKEVLCEDELGYLCDTQVRAQDISSMSADDFINLIVSNHNSHADSNKQFVVGSVNMAASVTTSLSFDTSLNTLITNLINDVGGILKLRYGTDGTRYIDYLTADGNQNNTVIALARNMRSVIVEWDVTNLVTRLIPLGKGNLTIATVNNNLDYIENTDAVKQFGIVEQKIDYSDIDDATALMAVGEKDLETISKPTVKLTVTAYDLSTIGIDATSFYVSDNVRVQNPAMKFDDTFRVIEKDTDLTKPYDITLTFDNKFERLADKQVQMQRTANFVSQISDKNGVNTYYLRNSIDATRNMIIASGAYKDKKYIENQGFLLENTDSTDASYGAMYLGPTGLLISNSKDADGNWVWTTAATGAGIIADALTTGVIQSKDGSFKIDLSSGKWTTYATDMNGFKALEMENRTIKGFDFVNQNQQIWQIETERFKDANGNATGAPILGTSIISGGNFILEELSSGEQILVLDNKSSDASKRQAFCHIDKFLITSKDSQGGVEIDTGSSGDALTLYGKFNCANFGLDNVGPITTSAGGTGWSGTKTVNGLDFKFENGILVSE